METYPGENLWDLDFRLLHEVLKRDEENLQNHTGVSSTGVILDETGGSTFHASDQLPNTSRAAPVLGKRDSSISEAGKAARKRKADKKYREKEKNKKVKMQLDLDNVSVAYDAVNRENQSLKEGIASMQQNFANQCRELVQLRSAYPQLKRELDAQKVLSDLLSAKLIADASQLELMEKLKNENASLRKNANLNSNEGQFLEEIAKLVAEKEALKVQNEKLKVQNDTLCGMMINQSP